MNTTLCSGVKRGVVASCEDFADIRVGNQGDEAPPPGPPTLFSVPARVHVANRTGCGSFLELVQWSAHPRMQEPIMPLTDPFSSHYAELLDGTYDCVDRIVLNGYFRFIQSPGGFRTWWRQLYGHDDNLDNAHLMRFAGRFARRVRYAAMRQRIPILEKTPDDRMHELAEQHRPDDPNRKGVFCITVHRTPNSVWGVIGTKNLVRKSPAPWLNHYAFHIQDPDWGHITIKVCPHPPFNVEAVLNGHEYVARQAGRKDISFTQEGNCFTDSSNLADLEKVAVTIRSKRAIGRLEQVCERWLYSACLCYLLPVADQNRTRMRFDWSVYQLEYCRNFLFQLGHTMDEVFQSIIDRTRCALDVRTIRTVFGRKKRPHWHRGGKRPRLEVKVERPTYDLTVFKVHFGLLSLKIYTKGERDLRVEATVHNAKKAFDRYGIGFFDEIANSLRQDGRAVFAGAQKRRCKLGHRSDFGVAAGAIARRRLSCSWCRLESRSDASRDDVRFGSVATTARLPGRTIGLAGSGDPWRNLHRATSLLRPEKTSW